MPYCHHIAGECPAGNNALKYARTACPAAPEKENDDVELDS
jgi:hypothetical protein